MADVKCGMPDADGVLALLNSAFDEWGDEDYLRWKYEQYPGFDPNRHVFFIERDGRLAAFRRLFAKELVVGGDRIPGFVLGDTAVAKSHRGQGLYSQLHSTTVEQGRESRAELVLTFNRTNNVTFEANRERGWRYRTLPLQMRILSPERVLEEYVDLVIDDWPQLKRIIDIAGDRVALDVDGERVPVSIFGEKSPGSERLRKRQLTVPVSTATVRRAVHAFGRQSKRGTVATLAGVSQSKPSGRVKRAGDTSDEVEITETGSPKDYGRIRTLYEAARSDDTVSFRRETEDIHHICRYPSGRRVLLAERDGDLCGFSVLGTAQNEEVTKCRVLDIVTTDLPTFRRLVDEIERISIERDHDVILMLSHRDAGRQWTPIRKQVVMWDSPKTGPKIEGLDGDWQVGLYDVV